MVTCYVGKDREGRSFDGWNYGNPLAPSVLIVRIDKGQTASEELVELVEEISRILIVPEEVRVLKHRGCWTVQLVAPSTPGRHIM